MSISILLLLPTFVLSTPYNGEKRKRCLKDTNVIQIDSLITIIAAVYLNIAFFSNKQHNFAQLLQNDQPMHCFINGNRNKLFLLFAYA